MKRFEIGMKVWIDEQTGPKRHFRGNCYAFIQGSYNDLCTPRIGGDLEYRVLFLDYRHGMITDGASWYSSDSMTFISDDPKEYIDKVRKYSKKKS